MSYTCESCGMPIEHGTYCQHCVDSDGQLQDFATRFERMVAWQQRRGRSRGDAEADTIVYMAGMPAWKTHPEVLARLSAD